MADKTEDEMKADAARADADAGEKLDKVLTCLDSLASRMDAMEAADKARADAASKTDEDDGKTPGEPKDVVADKRKDTEDGDTKVPEAKDDKARKDAEDAKEKAEEAKADAQTVAQRIADVERMLPKDRSDADYAAMADAQARADEVYQAFGDSAPRPLMGETVLDYRRRLVSKHQVHSASLKDVDLKTIEDPKAFAFMENQIFADAVAAATSPVHLPTGTLRESKRRDTTGREISTFHGQPRAWLDSFAAPRRRLVGIRNS